MMKVALVVMPFADADRPSLAAGLLKAAIEQAGIECDSKYFNVTFRQLLGEESYTFLSSEAPMTALAGEWAFSRVLFGHKPSSWIDYEREVLDDPVWGMHPDQRHHIRRALEVAPLFLRLAFESSDWGRYDLVGFTSTFEQTLPSLCLARMIREQHPHVRLAAGGANFEGDMGRAYIESFEFLDFVATGEADLCLPQLCENLRDAQQGGNGDRNGNSHGNGHFEVPPGFLYRDGGEVRAVPAADEAVDLDRLPTPNYDDFFRVAAAAGNGNGHADGNGTTAAGDRPRWIPVEASRGCWWGQKAHCTFCGLNGERMAFRRKSWQRVVEETDELGASQPDAHFQFADNIIDMGYFRDLLPFWAARRDPKFKYFEIKSNLDRTQLQLLADAGVSCVQAGVESLADATLRLMRKGVSGAQNVALLRWCAEIGIHPLWNVLYGFPGERPEDYDGTLEILRRITHLKPPDSVAPIRLDRFSPNYRSWRKHGFSAIEPMPAYRHVFPFPDETLEQLAYYFSYRHPQFAEALEAGSKLHGFVREWQHKCERQEQGELAVRSDPADGPVLIDSRFNLEPVTRKLAGRELALLSACDAPVSRARALRLATKQLSRASTPAAATGESLEPLLDELIESSVIAEVGGRLITLALMPERAA